jgi:hypothetical protein
VAVEAVVVVVVEDLVIEAVVAEAEMVMMVKMVMAKVVEVVEVEVEVLEVLEVVEEVLEVAEAEEEVEEAEVLKMPVLRPVLLRLAPSFILVKRKLCVALQLTKFLTLMRRFILKIKPKSEKWRKFWAL